MAPGTADGDEEAAPFQVHGTPGALGPVVIAIPHAGRAYPADLLASARVPVETLMRLEDRHADQLAQTLIDAGHCVLIAHAPRAMIDLNRDEREIDPGGIRALPATVNVQASAKVRGGLGLVPRRLAQAGDLWHAPLAWTELQRRIETIHRPYHAMLRNLLARTARRHGCALLVDLHSMPPLAHGLDPASSAPRIVIGDRFGRSAAPRLSTVALAAAESSGLTAALNHPYPGSHILDRHGRPWHGIHALQIEVDRSLYLDGQPGEPAASLRTMQAVVASMVHALARELVSWPQPAIAIAAE